MIKQTSHTLSWILGAVIFALFLFALPAQGQKSSSVIISNLCLTKQYIVWLDASSESIFRIKRTPATESAAPNAINITGAERIWKGEPLESPSSITVDASGNIYIADRESASIYLLTPGAAPKLIYSGSPLQRPTGIAIAESVLYVSDKTAATIFAFNLARKEIISEYKLTEPEGVLDRLKYSSGNLLAFDSNHRVIYRFTIDQDKLKTESTSVGEWRTITDYSTVSRSEKIDFSNAVTKLVDATFANDVVYVIDGEEARLVLIPLDGGEPSLLPYRQLATEPSAVVADEDELVMAEEGQTSRLRRFPVLLPATLFFEGLRSSSQVVDFYRYLYERQLLPVRYHKVRNDSTLKEFIDSKQALTLEYTPAFDALFCVLNAKICQTLHERGSSKSIPTEIKLEEGETVAVPDVRYVTYTARRTVGLPLNPDIYNPTVFKDVFDKPLGVVAEKFAPEGLGAEKLRTTLQKYNSWYSGPDILAEIDGLFVIPIQAGRIRAVVPKTDLLNPDSKLLKDILSQKNVTGVSPSLQLRPQSFARSNVSKHWLDLSSLFVNGGDCQPPKKSSSALTVLRHCLPNSVREVPEVGIIDNKFNANHPAFKESDSGESNLIIFKPSTVERKALKSRSKDTEFVEDLDHGTHIAAIIGARNPNGQMVGVYPDAKLYGALPEQVSDFFSELGSIRLVNISLGENGRSDGATRQEFDGTEVLKEILTQHSETLFVVAAGNDGQKIQSKSLASLGYLDNVLVVAASDTPSNPDLPPGLLQRRSGGKGSNYSQFLAGLAAPGEGILSALYNGDYGVADGTSQATAFVSGVAATLMAIEPNWRAWQIKFRLIAAADLWTHGSQGTNVISGEIDMRRVVLDTGFVVTQDDVRGVCKGQIAVTSRDNRLELKNPNDSIPLTSILRVWRHPNDESKYTIIFYTNKRLDDDQDRINRYLDRRVVSGIDISNDSFDFKSTVPSCQRKVSLKELSDFVNNFSDPRN